MAARVEQSGAGWYAPGVGGESRLSMVSFDALYILLTADTCEVGMAALLSE